MNINNRLVRQITAFLVVCYSFGYGQVNTVYQSNKNKFKDEPGVYLNRIETLSIILANDSLNVYTENEEDFLILKEQSGTFSNRKIFGSHFYQVKDIEAKTLVWDNNKYKPIKVSEFKKNSDPGSSVFYDDSYHYSFNFPSVAVQNRTLLKYKQQVKDVKFIGGFNFSTYLPQNEIKFIIRASKGVELYYKVINDPDNKIAFNISEKNGIVTYQWSATDFPKINFESDSPPISYFSPQVLCYVKSYKNSKGTVNVISSLDDLYKWYSSFVSQLNLEPTDEMKKVAEIIVNESKGEEEIVRKIFYWVQTNIQYVAFEDGMRGLIPHPSGYVCEKKFGDCKDMASLIVGLLKACNVKAYFTWIGTRDIPFKYSELPTPLVDNHMIATYINKNGEYIYLDGTGDFTPYGLPTSMIQGKEALIGLDADHYELKTVPVVEQMENHIVDSIKIEISDGFVKGSGVSFFNGYLKTFRAHRLLQKEKNQEYVASILSLGSNKFYLDQFNLANVENNDVSTVIDYKFRIGDYYQNLGSEIYLNLNLNKEFYNEQVNLETRTQPIETEFKFSEREYVEFKIPTGYVVEYIPENASYTHDLLDYSIEYEIAGDKILYRKNLALKYLMLDPGEFKSWNEAINHISESYRESIILKKKE